MEEGIKLLTDANSTIKDVPKFTLSYLEILAKNGKTELALKGLNEYITKNTKDMKPEDYPLVVYTDKLRIYSSIPNFLSDKKIRPLFDRALNQGLKLDDKNANLAYFKMLTFIEKRKLDQAFAAFQVILAGNPRHYKAFLALGAFLLKKRGFFKDAKAMLDEAIKIRKVKASYKVSETLAEISDLFKKARKKKEAQTYLEMSEKVKQGKEI